MELAELEITNITKDKRTQPRAIIDEFIVNEYRLDMLNGDSFPPPVVFKENGNNYLADGWHRVAAAEMIGKTTIWCGVIDGTLRDAILYSCSVNADHGKRRTNGDKERAVKKLLNDSEWATWGDHEIARQCKVTHPFVGRIRKEILVTVTSMDNKRTFIHPKTGMPAIMDVSNIGRKSEPIPDDEPEPTPDFFNTPLPEPKQKYDPLNYRLFVSPINELSDHVEPASIDAIITDPPYPKEYMHCYEELAEQASIILKPGGILVAMAGHNYIDAIIEMMKHHLHYHWLGCYYMPEGHHASLAYYGVSVYWKPLIIMSRGDWIKTNTFKDTMINDNADKNFHEWGQGISGFERIIENFTKPNQTVLDPFVGGGTTAIAALNLGRYFIGSDISPDEVTKTEDRLHG